MEIKEDVFKVAMEFLRKNPEIAQEKLGVNIELVTDEVLPESKARIEAELKKIAPFVKAIDEIGGGDIQNIQQKEAIRNC